MILINHAGQSRAGRNPRKDQNGQIPMQDEQGRLMPRMSSANRLTSQDRSAFQSLSRGCDDSKSEADGSSIHTTNSENSYIHAIQPGYDPDDELDRDEAAAQDVEEIWFPGCHADLGGGWPRADGEESPLSHGPLVWMVREAQKAGMDFDQEKMRTLGCCDDDFNTYPTVPTVPEVQVTEPTDLFRNPPSDHALPGWAPGLEPETRTQSVFHKTLHTAATKGVLHDCLEFNNGLSTMSVLSWKIMEYLPFRRMDLNPDGSWSAISWPLPMGEVRDIPENAKVHNSAIRRMEANERYRPGNLIVGGGGRGVRKAPKEMGIGQWEVLRDQGDPVGEIYVRKGPSADAQMK